MILSCVLKMSELSDQIERNNKVLKLLQDLDCNFKRFEAVEKIEDALTGLKVIEFEGTCIRFSLTTYVPNVEHLLSQHKIEDKIDSMEQNHNLVVEVEEGTMNIKNVQIFPNDVYIGEIIDAAKSLRSVSSLTSGFSFLFRCIM
ncbi:hypothetical protein RJ639_031459 [Escallonia herrerae]|uniref:Uncharacterized protein n=1 Tax=Escallonia herrerae TaxID=1293975 RepID=A0AA88X7S6_9ASTE|nr:hypothetical protein RJ639_031459 [Escallonia herrerae]